MYDAVVFLGFMGPGKAMKLCALSDLMVGRAVRCVSELEMVAGGGYGIVSIVPVAEDYMKENISAEYAVSQGLTTWNTVFS